MTTSALARLAVADAAVKYRPAHGQARHTPPFSMESRLKTAEPTYALLEERKADCDDMKAGV